MTRQNYVLTGFIFVLLMGIVFAGETEKVVIGDRLTLNSKVLNEERTVLVYRPEGYERYQTQYPVLYLLDGGYHFHHVTGIVQFLSSQGYIPQLVVVGLPNTDRRRDFTPTKINNVKASGGADDFMEFMEKELFPFVEENYRVAPYRILVGHSLCGMFSIYSLFTKPDLFSAYIAISPWLLHNDQLLVKNAEKMFKKNKSLNKFLFMTVGNEPELIPVLDQFSTYLLEYAPEKLTWKYENMQNDTHGTVVHNSVYNGLLEHYLDWRLPHDLGKNAVTTIKKHYKKLSEKYGYPVQAPESQLNQLGYMILNSKMYDQAIAVFKLNVEKYPDSPNVYDSLGEAYENSGELKLALANYEIAVDKGKIAEDNNLKTFEEHAERVKKKMNETSQVF